MAYNIQYTPLLRVPTKKQYTAQQKIDVWNKARIVQGYNSAYVRADACGALIEWGRYGDITSRYGWEIDHIMPKSLGGADVITNLQPLQWQNNRAKGDNLSLNYCVVKGY